MRDCRPLGVALRGEASNCPLLRWLKTVVVSDEGKGARDASGGDQEGVASKVPLRDSPLIASLFSEVASEPGVTAWPGMSLAVARIAGQVVPGAEVARAWPAAFMRNVGWRAPTLPPRRGRREGELQASETRGAEYRRVGAQADRPVVAVKFLLDAVGAERRGRLSVVRLPDQPGRLGGISWASMNHQASRLTYRGRRCGRHI